MNAMCPRSGYGEGSVASTPGSETGVASDGAPNGLPNTVNEPPFGPAETAHATGVAPTQAKGEAVDPSLHNRVQATKEAGSATVVFPLGAAQIQEDESRDTQCIENCFNTHAKQL